MEDRELYNALTASTAASNTLADVLKTNATDLRTDMREFDRRLRQLEDEFDTKLDGVKTSISGLDEKIDKILVKQEANRHMLRTLEYGAIVGASLFASWDWIQTHVLSRI